MRNQGLTLLEVLVVIVLIGILAALLLPSIHVHGHPNRKIACANNLRQLYTLGTVYASTHHGEWPTATGENLWLSFTKMVPPLIEPEHASLLHCDLADDELGTDETNYRGPLLPWKKLTGGDVLAADREGNHGDGESINVLFKEGTVLEATPGDSLWKKCREVLGP